MTCSRCQGRIFIDFEDSRCPEYVCTLCARRSMVNPPQGVLVPIELMKRGHHKREVRPEVIRALRWGLG